MKAFYFLIITILTAVANEQEVEWFDAQGKSVRITREAKVEKESQASELLTNDAIHWSSHRTFRNRTVRGRGLYRDSYWLNYGCRWPNNFYRGWGSSAIYYSGGSSVYRSSGYGRTGSGVHLIWRR